MKNLGKVRWSTRKSEEGVTYDRISPSLVKLVDLRGGEAIAIE